MPDTTECRPPTIVTLGTEDSPTVGIAGVAGAEDHAAQIRIANQVPVAALQRSQQLAGIGIECVDESIAKDENVVAERRRRRIR